MAEPLMLSRCYVPTSDDWAPSMAVPTWWFGFCEQMEWSGRELRRRCVCGLVAAALELQAVHFGSFQGAASVLAGVRVNKSAPNGKHHRCGG